MPPSFDHFHAGIESNLGKAGFMTVLTMLGEPTPPEIEAQKAAVRALATGLLRRLVHAPEGDRMIRLLREGSAARPGLLADLLA